MAARTEIPATAEQPEMRLPSSVRSPVRLHLILERQRQKPGKREASIHGEMCRFAQQVCGKRQRDVSKPWR